MHSASLRRLPTRSQAGAHDQDLENRPDVQVTPDPPTDVKPQQAIEQYRHFLELQSKNEKMRTEAMRRLGDLQVEVDEAARAAGVESGVEGMELKEAIQLYEGLLKSHPDYPRNDAVMYQLSRAHEAQASPEKALAVLDQLVAKYPQSPWYTEAQFRRGEILFSATRYHDAERAYAAVIKSGEGDFYQQGLYKHGWSLFKQSRGEEGTDSFLKVLDRILVSDGKLRERDSLTRPERELSEDTLRVNGDHVLGSRRSRDARRTAQAARQRSGVRA
ncbi:MAG: tetratricopeptide repeat protein, partial [Gammaproteobacteria bacterium]|nr:tetratricopeptide repeat protein [Gammaproteobacteria bacterium]